MRMKLKLLLLVALVASFVAISPAGADHDLVYAPCDPEDTRSVDERVWYIDYQSGVILRYDDPWWGERPGMMGYTNWHFQCGLGMTGVWQAAPILPQPHPPDYVIDTRSPAVVCDAATGYTRMGAVEIEQRVNALIPDGIDLNSLTITDTGIIIAGTPSPMLVEAGIIREWAVDHNGTSRHYLDLYWEYKFTHLPNETFWVAGCMATPVEPPPHTPSSSSTSTTSTTTSAPSVVTTTTTQAPSTTTSTTTLVPTPTVYDEPPLPPLDNDPIPGVDTSTDVDNVIVTLDPSYDLYDAEWDGWPFEITVRLLEQRYVPNTPDRRHFPMSVAVDYLRGGGMIGGLDEIWEWP